MASGTSRGLPLFTPDQYRQGLTQCKLSTWPRAEPIGRRKTLFSIQIQRVLYSNSWWSPALHLFPQYLHSAFIGFPVLAFLWNWVKSQTEIWNRSLHGRVEVRNLGGYRPSSKEQRFVMAVNMRLICIFWVELFRQKKAKFCLLFRLKKKPSALKNIQNFKICKNPSAKTAEFKN